METNEAARKALGNIFHIPIVAALRYRDLKNKSPRMLPSKTKSNKAYVFEEIEAGLLDSTTLLGSKNAKAKFSGE